MEDYIDFIKLGILGIGVIIVTKYALIQGILWVSSHWRVPRKVQGQILGYATSAPELVGTLATASKGLLGAGLWNVASSNIINVVLFFSAAMVYKRTHPLKQTKFIDEIGFALGAIALPALLVTQKELAESPWVALFLFAYFVTYIIVDRKVNAKTEEESGATEKGGKGWLGLGLIALGILGIIVLGHFLGIAAESIVKTMNVPEWGVGWLLGFITSLPELTSFFAVFAASQSEKGDDDIQQNLDNLAASNMSNVGLIYPLGIIVAFWVAT